MPRLFTGLKIPKQLAAQLSLLRGGISGARWIEPEDYHITLGFMGDIDPATADEVVLGLETLHASSISLQVCGLDSFGHKKSRAIFARIEANDVLAQLQKSHENLLRNIGIPMQARKYVPHITLARTSQANPTDVLKFLSANSGFTSELFQISQFTLFSARESVGGGPYHSEAVFDL